MRFISKTGDISTIEISAKESARIAQILEWVFDCKDHMDDATLMMSIDDVLQTIYDWEKFHSDYISNVKIELPE